MNKDRFCNILRFLHFADNSVQDNTSLKKLNPFLKMLEDALISKYTPSQKMSVDEFLFIYEGRLHFRQYIKSKRLRFGMKIFKLVDSNGVTIRCKVYTGQWRLKIVLYRKIFRQKTSYIHCYCYTSPKLYSFLKALKCTFKQGSQCQKEIKGRTY